MARLETSLKVDGLDKLQLSLQEIAAIPDDVAREMLTAGGMVAADAQRRKIRALGLVKSGQLAGSITVQQKLVKDARRDNAPAVLILPSGTRQPTSRGLRRRKSGKKGRRRTGNNDVGFVQEFGAPRRNIPGKQWMAQANAECADAVTAAEFSAYDDWLKSKDL